MQPGPDPFAGRQGRSAAADGPSCAPALFSDLTADQLQQHVLPVLRLHSTPVNKQIEAELIEQNGGPAPVYTPMDESSDAPVSVPVRPAQAFQPFRPAKKADVAPLQAMPPPAGPKVHKGKRTRNMVQTNLLNNVINTETGLPPERKVKVKSAANHGIDPKIYDVPAERIAAFKASLPRWRPSVHDSDWLRDEQQLEMVIMDVRVHEDKLALIGVLDNEPARDTDEKMRAPSEPNESKSSDQGRAKHKIGVQIDYQPYLWVEWPSDLPDDRIGEFAEHVNLFRPTGRDDPHLHGCRWDRKSDPTEYEILRSELDLRTQVAGFQDNKKTKCVRLLCSSESARLYYAARFRSTMMQGHVFKVFNADFDARLQFLAERNLTIAGWCRIQSGRFQIVEDDDDLRFRHLQYEIRCNAQDMVAFQRNDTGGLIRAYFDIETVSGTSSTQFGFALNRHDLCVAISVFIEKTATTPERTYVFLLGDSHNSERDMLNDFAHLLTQVDVLHSYNGNLYDVPYLLGRADVTKSDFRHLSCFRRHDVFQSHHRRAWLEDPKKGVRAYDLPGWWHIDLYRLVMRKEIDAKNGNKLKQVLAYIFKDQSILQKIDLKPLEIRPCFLDPEQRIERLKKYAERDANVLPPLANKCQVFLNAVETMRLTRISSYDMNVKGEQIKLFQLLGIRVLTGGWALNKDDVAALSRKFFSEYAGGRVFEAKRGLWRNVFVCDFSSLYPSIMMENNICYTTLVDDPALLEELKKRPGVVLNKIELTDTVVVYFVNGVDSLLPALERDLIAERKRVRKTMEAAQEAADFSKNRSSHLKEWSARSKEEIAAQIERLESELLGLRELLQGETTADSLEWVKIGRQDEHKKLKDALPVAVALKFLHRGGDVELEKKRLEQECRDLKLLADVLNARQLIVKRCANAGYGFAGVGGRQEQEEMDAMLQKIKREAAAAKRGKSLAELEEEDEHMPKKKNKRGKKQWKTTSYLPCPVIARCITARGRAMITTVEQYARSEYHAEIVYGDTDSLFLAFPPPPPELDDNGEPVTKPKHIHPEDPTWVVDTSDYDKQYYFGIATEFAHKATKKFFRDPVEFAPEKLISSLLMVRRKGYDSEQFNKVDDKFPVNKQTGLHVVRGDWSQLSKDFGKDLLAVFSRRKGTFDDAEKIIRKQADDMLKKRVPLEKYILSNAIGDLSLYANPHAQRHTHVAAVVAKENPTAAFAVGERVEYCMVKGSGGRGAKTSQNAVWVETVKEKKLPLDLAWYWESQCWKPSESFLSAIDKERTDRLFKELSGKFAPAQDLGLFFGRVPEQERKKKRPVVAEKQAKPKSIKRRKP